MAKINHVIHFNQYQGLLTTSQKAPFGAPWNPSYPIRALSYWTIYGDPLIWFPLCRETLVFLTADANFAYLLAIAASNHRASHNTFKNAWKTSSLLLNMYEKLPRFSWIMELIGNQDVMQYFRSPPCLRNARNSYNQK